MEVITDDDETYSEGLYKLHWIVKFCKSSFDKNTKSSCF